MIPTPVAVDIWSIALDSPGCGGTEDLALLDAGEHAQAARLATADLQRRFVARRAGLRRVLATRLAREPAAIRYRSSPFGRPGIVDGDIDFSLSHRGERALIAICDAGTRIGVDLERIDAARAARDLLAPFVGPAIADEVNRALEAGVLEPFFAWWTAVEAMAKARGTGLADAAPARAEHSWLSGVTLADDAGVHRRWVLQRWVPDDGYVAALVSDAPVSIRRRVT